MLSIAHGRGIPKGKKGEGRAGRVASGDALSYSFFMAANKRIGILGGSFNPVHTGHLRVAEEVLEIRDLDRVYLVPCHIPPHKSARDMAPAGARLHMARLATQGNRRLGVCDFEITRNTPSYTLETLGYFRKRFGRKARLFFILGADAFAEISSWYRYRSLFEAAGFIVMTRPGHDPFDLPGALGPEAAREFKPDRSGRGFVHTSGNALWPTEVTLLDISASGIRARRKKGLSIRYLVPDPVYRYIRRRGLYL